MTTVLEHLREHRSEQLAAYAELEANYRRTLIDPEPDPDTVKRLCDELAVEPEQWQRDKERMDQRVADAATLAELPTITARQQQVEYEIGAANDGHKRALEELQQKHNAAMSKLVSEQHKLMAREAQARAAEDRLRASCDPAIVQQEQALSRKTLEIVQRLKALEFELLEGAHDESGFPTLVHRLGMAQGMVERLTREKAPAAAIATHQGNVNSLTRQVAEHKRRIEAVRGELEDVNGRLRALSLAKLNP